MGIQCEMRLADGEVRRLRIRSRMIVQDSAGHEEGKETCGDYGLVGSLAAYRDPSLSRTTALDLMSAITSSKCCLRLR